MSEKFVYKTAEMPANRGDILTNDGRLLASSVPYYTIYMDTRSSGMSAATWSNGINGLSVGIAERLAVRDLLPDGNQQQRKPERKETVIFLLKRKVNYETLKQIKALPIFREGQYKGRYGGSG